MLGTTASWSTMPGSAVTKLAAIHACMVYCPAMKKRAFCHTGDKAADQHCGDERKVEVGIGLPVRTRRSIRPVVKP